VSRGEEGGSNWGRENIRKKGNIKSE